MSLENNGYEGSVLTVLRERFGKMKMTSKSILVALIVTTVPLSGAHASENLTDECSVYLETTMDKVSQEYFSLNPTGRQNLAVLITDICELNALRDLYYSYNPIGRQNLTPHILSEYSEVNANYYPEYLLDFLAAIKD